MSCIRLVKERAAQAVGLDFSKIQEQKGELVRFCAMITGMSQEDEYVLPLGLSKNGDWSNLALFQEPGHLESEDETEAFQISHGDLMMRRSITVSSPRGWAHWSQEAFGSQTIDGYLQAIVYTPDDMDVCRLGRAYELTGILNESDNPEFKAVLHLVSIVPAHFGLGYGLATAKELSTSCASARSDLLNHLTAILGGNREAAGLLLAHLVSKMYKYSFYI